MKEIFIERREKILRIGVKSNNELIESIVEEKKNQPIIGELYKGRIKNILPAINSIFVDLGLDKEGYMYYSDELKANGIKKGDEILVEVIKEPLNDKGAKLTHKASIPGKYVVLNCYKKGIDFSKRITDKEKKDNILKNISPLEDVCITVRTEGANVSLDIVQKEIDKLYKEFKNIDKQMKYSTNLKKLYGEDLSLTKILMNSIGEEITKIYVNNKDDFDKISSFIEGENNFKLEEYEGYRNLFDFYGLEKELLKLRHNKVNLNCGGYIVIDRTEAMYVIDVNSGKNIKERNFNKTILETNLEAAKEIGRQIRLRNLSGIIMIDFIDMRDKSQKDIVMSALKESLKLDKGNVKIFPFTELDLVQIARKRQGKSIYEYMEEECRLCKGRGIILKLSYIKGLIKNEIIRIKEENSISCFHVQVDSVYKERIKENIFEFIKDIDGLDKEIYLTYADNIEGYKVEPLIFQGQKDNLQDYKVTVIEKG
ncbi:Rne/Rng family ribonuclease [Clostridium saccharobutylicum]|uniref:Ribonuclease G n=1 Tax=Clostridium saccharobutylicum DSM 13864 TaxID=1345695 RepID=U5MQE1_CLOSA|nr:Rne/Rng family ribonuclease [Clostridium saccharobutylicum]AGX41652.1 ribonuclease G [Clostridium saccharobutylicum DSM 13864]AQR88935.1 ribonuclease G [Clostridium saccharobutylicum]AQR98836.1 ribonuclease G [Clostridium saccharobutylicum]AQS12824.1 ribonuclease G [Clostridium saccharobutylicum]MBA2904062.1 ribonuclease G [Clostridium saccharobutylicum]